ncbi:MAG: transcription elongation factor GreA [Candidatus Cloacimonetes bacterium]|nr:transcription elongation factor GreA [Candidatus Cloacimonadota bacterium]
MAEYITREGMAHIQRKMQRLIKERPEVVRRVQIAREMGDLSENAEYKAAREEQRNIENEYNHLKSRVEVLQVIDTDAIPKDAIRFGARVTMEELSTNQTLKIRMVGTDELIESDDGYERRSVNSPFGRALIGKKVGEIATVKAPIGMRKFKILDIK